VSAETLTTGRMIPSAGTNSRPAEVSAQRL